jgi:1-acyl-sn-glycerol-3-phosphate acyltransferase
MEGALMAVYSHRQVEMLGAGDIPQEKITEFFEGVYDYIPIRRGHVDRPALQQTLDILKQGGVVGIFPEGGVWEPNQMRAQTGVSWLSYRSGAPVLPMAFAGTSGAISAATKFKRPLLVITIGDLIPAAKIPTGQGRKTYFENYAEQVMDAVRGMLPPDDPSLQINIKDERFELEISLRDTNSQSIEIPPEYSIHHAEALVKLLHRPTILKIFRFNLQLPIEAVEQLHTEPTAKQIAEATRLMLDAMQSKYAYLLAYRFGPKEGHAMQQGLEALHKLATWADEQEYSLKVRPIRRYYCLGAERHITQVEQDVMESWM